MRLPDGSILMHGDLEHRAPYDARKAHEYYLRTRKLKGREKGNAEPTPNVNVVPIRGFNVPKVKKKPTTQHGKNVEYLNSVSKRMRELNKNLALLLSNAHQSSVKKGPAAKKEEAGKDEAPKTAEELKTQISNLQGRLTSAIAKLEKLSEPAP